MIHDQETYERRGCRTSRAPVPARGRRVPLRTKASKDWWHACWSEVQRKWSTSRSEQMNALSAVCKSPTYLNLGYEVFGGYLHGHGPNGPADGKTMVRWRFTLESVVYWHYCTGTTIVVLKGLQQVYEYIRASYVML